MTANTWQEANQQYLMAALGRVREILAQHVDQSSDVKPGAPDLRACEAAEHIAAAMPTPPALCILGDIFGLSSFERDVLLLCAGMELDPTFAGLCGAAQGDSRCAYPTFNLALAALPGAHWRALSPAAPLRYWRLIEIGSGSGVTSSPLRLDERILHYLVGVQHLDERLVGFVEPVQATDDLVPSHGALAERLAATWAHPAEGSAVPAVQVCGENFADQQAIAAAAAAMVHLDLHRMSAQVIPINAAELEALMRLWAREAVLTRSALLLDCHDLETQDLARDSALTRLIEGTRGALIVASRERRRIRQRPLLTFDVPQVRPEEQRALWYHALGPAMSRLNGQVEALVTQFNLPAAAIRTAATQVVDHLPRQGSPDSATAEALGRVLWETCRVQARPRIDNLAQPIEPVATWDDLVLPPRQCQTLREIAIHVRQRLKVYEQWGFAAKSARGLGISALFTGVSGTGKTMAAEVLANELRLDLYRIDLSQVVSKYIGETEKNLRRVFDAAEGGGAILLFDEADALFGKRSEVKDSHDRYANIEISYLLQRMEVYRGLAILTTNLKEALDTAFMRRLRFIVQFPFPDAAQRAEIWRRIFPVETPTEGLAVEKLARLNVAGGNIHNIAMHAAFLAADAGQPVRMAHLLQAARNEYAKLEQALSGAEIGGWV